MDIPGKAMHIYLQRNAIPSQISISQLIPLHMQTAATQVISDLLNKQVITKVNKPTQWCGTVLSFKNLTGLWSALSQITQN